MNVTSSTPLLRDLDFSQKIKLQRLFEKEQQGETLSQQECELLDRYRHELHQELNKIHAVWPVIIFVLIVVVLFQVFGH